MIWKKETLVITMKNCEQRSSARLDQSSIE